MCATNTHWLVAVLVREHDADACAAQAQSDHLPNGLFMQHGRNLGGKREILLPDGLRARHPTAYPDGRRGGAYSRCQCHEQDQCQSASPCAAKSRTMAGYVMQGHDRSWTVLLGGGKADGWHVIASFQPDGRHGDAH